MQSGVISQKIHDSKLAEGANIIKDWHKKVIKMFSIANKQKLVDEMVINNY